MAEARTAAPARTMPSFGEFIAMMAALMALTALSIDVMLPALPQIRDEFGLADPNRMQLVVTAYLIGFAVGQLERLAPRRGQLHALRHEHVAFHLSLHWLARRLREFWVDGARRRRSQGGD